MKQNLKNKISLLYGFPMGRTSFKLYFSMLNEQGKITQRSLLDLLILIFEYLDENETNNQTSS